MVDGAVSDTHLDSHVSAAEQQEYYEWVMAEIAKYDRAKERTEPCGIIHQGKVPST